MNKVTKVDKVPILHKRNSVGDIRAYFERQTNSPKLLKFERKRSTSESGDPRGESIPLQPLHNTLTTSKMEEKKTEEDSWSLATNKLTKKKKKTGLQQLTQAVGELVGIGTQASGGRGTEVASKAGDLTEGTPQIEEGPKKPEYIDYLTITGTCTNTPLSEAASMEGNLSDDENIQLLDAGDGNINLLQMTEGGQPQLVVCTIGDGGVHYAPPLDSLPQRVKVNPTLSTPKAGYVSARKISTPVRASGGATKRALPYSPEKIPSKTSRASKSAPVTSGSENEGDTPMESTPPTARKLNTRKTNQEKSCCQNTQETIDLLLQRIQALELKQSQASDSLDRLTSNTLDHMNTLTDTVVRIDEAVEGQKNEQIKLYTELQDTKEQAKAISHDLHKTQQSVAQIAGKQDKLTHEWTKLQEKLQQSNINVAQNQTVTDDHALFLGGIHALRDFFKSPNADPAQIVKYLLMDLHMYCSMDRCGLADGQARTAGDRMQARAMVIVMRSVQHKKETIIRIKRYLGQNQIRNVTVSDIFPPDKIEKVKAYSRYAQKAKNEKKIARYRVVNKEGNVTLQIQERNNGKYKDYQPTEEQLASSSQDSMRPTTAMEIDAEAGSSTNDGGVRKKAVHAKGANAQPLGQKAVNTQMREQQGEGANETQMNETPYMRRAGIPPPPFQAAGNTSNLNTFSEYEKDFPLPGIQPISRTTSNPGTSQARTQRNA